MNALKNMFPFIRPYRWVAFWMLVAVILPVAMELIVPRALRVVIDQGIEAGNASVIYRYSVYMLAAAVVGALATLVQGVLRARLSQGLAFDIRHQMFTHIQTFSFANLDQMQTGQLMTRLTSDVDLVRMFVSAGVALLLRAFLMVGGSIVMMATIDFPLTVVMLTILPLAGLVIWGIIRLAHPLFNLVQQKLAVLNTITQENLAGVQVVKAFVRERFEIGRFQENNLDFTDESIRVGRLMAVAAPLLTILTNLGLVAVIWYGGLSVEGGRLSVGELVAFNNYLMIGMAPLLLLGNILTMMSRADVSAARVWEVLNTKPAIQPNPSPHLAPVNGRISFHQVSFRYHAYNKENGQGHFESANGDQPATGLKRARRVLRDVSFSIEPGQRVALLGATGSGKSTLVNLIPRFYDVDGGRIEVDGVDVRQWDVDALRARIGVVLQQTTLFSGTIRENIAYGRPGAPMEEVIAAAKAAQAHDFIMTMGGYDSLVEERGANLSGGQKQRIAIARALLISPSILILDDATSAVDMETEAEVQLALERLMDGRTTIIVAQRISSVLTADQIIVLDDGQICAQGNHQQLLQTSDIYQEIYHSQMGTNDGFRVEGSSDGQ